MVALTFFRLLAIAVLVVPSGLRAAGAPSDLLASSFSALQRCDARRAKDDASRIDKLETFGPELGALYRITWIEQGSGQPGQKHDEAKPTLVWQLTPETWGDEAVTWTCHERSSTADTVLVGEILQPYLNTSGPSLPELRTVASRWVFDHWALGKPVETFATVEDVAEGDCEWTATLLLPSSNSESAERLGTFFARCSNIQGPAAPVLWAAHGDYLLKAGKFAPAFSAYNKAASLVAPDPVSRSLWYRLAVSAFLGGQHDDVAFRATVRVMTMDAGGDSDLDRLVPVQITALSNLSCDRLAHLNAGKALGLFERIFEKPWMPTVASLLDGCDPKAVAQVYRALLARTKPALTTTLRARTLSKLIEASVDAGTRRRYVQQLTRLADQHPESPWIRTKIDRALRAESDAKKAKKKPVRVESEDAALSADKQVESKPLTVPVSAELSPIVWAARGKLGSLKAFESAVKSEATNRKSP